MCRQSPSFTIWVKDQTKTSTRNPNLPEFKVPIQSPRTARGGGKRPFKLVFTSIVLSLAVKGAIITVNKTAFKHMTDKESTMGEV